MYQKSSNFSRLIFQVSVYFKDRPPKEIVDFTKRDPKALLVKDGVFDYKGIKVKRITVVVKSLSPLLDKDRVNFVIETLEFHRKFGGVVDFVIKSKVSDL